MNKVGAYWDKTKGYKTATGGILLLLFQGYKLIFPDSLSCEWEEWIYNAIGVVSATGILDKLWRNRKKLTEGIKKIFTFIKANDDSDMKISQQGIELIKRHEGLRLTSYICPGGKWTIGYGHTKNAKKGLIITEEQAEQFLRDDLKQAEDTIKAENLNLNQNQFDALVSFVFNLGSYNFKRSALLRLLKEGKPKEEVAKQFGRWVNAGGKKLAGLVRRREEESVLFLK